MPALDKFTKLRDGDAWVLEEQTPTGLKGERLEIIQNKLDDELKSVTLYLWGTEDENNPYATPKDFLIFTIRRLFEAGDLQLKVLVEDKFIDAPVRTMGMYFTTVNKGTSKARDICGYSENEVIYDALEYLSNNELMDIINTETMLAVVPVYCINGNPCDLTVGDGIEAELQQIGYALVDVSMMQEETFLDDPAEIVEEYLESKDFEDIYSWEYSVWDDTIEDWVYVEDGGEFIGDDPVANGFFEFWEKERNIYWQDAQLDEWIEDGEVTQDWPDDYDDDDDGLEDDDDMDDWFDDDDFITEE